MLRIYDLQLSLPFPDASDPYFQAQGNHYLMKYRRGIFFSSIKIHNFLTDMKINFLFLVKNHYYSMSSHNSLGIPEMCLGEFSSSSIFL